LLEWPELCPAHDSACFIAAKYLVWTPFNLALSHGTNCKQARCSLMFPCGKENDIRVSIIKLKVVCYEMATDAAHGATKQLAFVLMATKQYD